jgi:putative ABC transport system permease protein
MNNQGLRGLSPQARLAVVIGRKIIAGRGRRLVRLVALFMAPAFIICIATFTVSALQLTADQRAQSYMGSATGVLLPVPEEFANPADLLRAGHGQVTAHLYVARLGYTVFVNHLERETLVITADWTSAVARSRWHLIAGHWPVGSREVAVTSAARKSLQAGQGGTVRMGGLAGPIRVVGVVEDSTALHSVTVLGSPGFGNALAHANPNASTAASAGYLLTGPQADVAAVVRAARRAGAAARTRDEVRAVQAQTLLRSQSLTVTVPGIVLVVVLSAAAFIVRVRRAGRQMAILMALGVRPATLVWAARLAAVAAALLGAVLGVLIATAVNTLIGPALGRAAGHEVGVASFSLWSALLTAAIVTGSAAVAAWLPARVAGRGVAKFDGAPPQAASGKALGAGAAALLAVASVVAFSVDVQPPAYAALGAATLAAVILIPSALRLLVTVTKRTPLLVRVASRQLARNTRRPAAAITVGMAAMIAAVGCLTYYNTLRAVDRRADGGSTHAGTAAVPLRRIGPTPALIAQLRDTAGTNGRVGALTEVLPTAQIPASNRLLTSPYYVVVPAGQGGGALDAVASTDDFAAIAGRRPTPQEWRALTQGQVLHLGGAPGTYTMRADATQPDTAKQTRTRGASGRRVMMDVGPSGPRRFTGPQITFDAVASDPVADPAHTDADFLVGPMFVAQHHLYLETIYLYVSPGGGIDPELGDRVRHIAEQNGIAASEVIFNTGSLVPLPFDWRLVLVSAVVLLWLGVGICMLAMSEDARPFYQSLYALGFASWRQRLILMTQAVLIAVVAVGLGTLLGLAAGVASVHILGATPAIAMGNRTILLLASGAIIGSAAIGAVRPGQRATDELNV